jgi:hypothetical protein
MNIHGFGGALPAWARQSYSRDDFTRQVLREAIHVTVRDERAWVSAAGHAAGVPERGESAVRVACTRTKKPHDNGVSAAIGFRILRKTP